jgi:hypothetical protein
MNTKQQVAMGLAAMIMMAGSAMMVGTQSVTQAATPAAVTAEFTPLASAELPQDQVRDLTY